MRREKRIQVLVFSLLLVPCYLLPAQTGVIRDLTGTVELSAAGGAFVPAAVGAQMQEDTVISTGFRSSAVVELGSVLIAVRPLTRMSLTEIRSSAGTETVNVNLQAGRVRVDVNPPAGVRTSMSVTTPSTTASVRGTSFEFDTRSLSVESGRVDFRGLSGQEISIGQGFSIVIGESGSAFSPFALGSARLRPNSPGGGDRSPGSIGGIASGGGGGGPDPGPGPGPGPGPNGPSTPGGGGPGGGDPSGPSGPNNVPEVNVVWD
ncbi:MAG: FecR family protein [Treponema sp.]|nr:FecR family protein [Treponema sp.]